ncbi:hypothetical protein QBC38DRAFT_52883 [Podospora fimiseda]|uniref:Uncharacterized protein n=1 Tax=Podospora fimiseda TaxID=252190 RepID=A0AAN7BHL7_9PEZI|nr:hypothetical protein QBC38DRAFT_52883 [Podospora fimiseda]
MDRAGALAPYRDLVKTFDFTADEVHELGPLLEFGDLTGQYLSNMAKETSHLGEGPLFPVADPRLNIKRKAHGLVRVAKYIRSPRYSGDGHSLFQQLGASETWETDDISSTMSITLEGNSRSIFLEKSDVYIGNDESEPLKIFIPHEESAQDVCVQGSLPRKLVEWLMTDPETVSRMPIRDMEKAVGVVKGAAECKDYLSREDLKTRRYSRY